MSRSFEQHTCCSSYVHEPHQPDCAATQIPALESRAASLEQEVARLRGELGNQTRVSVEAIDCLHELHTARRDQLIRERDTARAEAAGLREQCERLRGERERLADWIRRHSRHGAECMTRYAQVPPIEAEKKCSCGLRALNELLSESAAAVPSSAHEAAPDPLTAPIEQVDAELRAIGVDPVKLGEDGVAFVKKVKAEFEQEVTALRELERWARRFETEPQGVGLDAVEQRMFAALRRLDEIRKGPPSAHQEPAAALLDRASALLTKSAELEYQHKVTQLMDAAEVILACWSDFTSQEMYGEHLQGAIDPEDFENWANDHDVLRRRVEALSPEHEKPGAASAPEASRPAGDGVGVDDIDRAIECVERALPKLCERLRADREALLPLEGRVNSAQMLLRRARMYRDDPTMAGSMLDNLRIWLTEQAPAEGRERRPPAGKVWIEVDVIEKTEGGVSLKIPFGPHAWVRDAFIVRDHGLPAAEAQPAAGEEEKRGL